MPLLYGQRGFAHPAPHSSTCKLQPDKSHYFSGSYSWFHRAVLVDR